MNADIPRLRYLARLDKAAHKVFSGLALFALVTIFVVYFHLLMILNSLYCKQYVEQSDHGS